MAYRYSFDTKSAQHFHYLANRSKYIARARATDVVTKRRLRALIDEYKRTHPCVDCGETDPVVLEFDHGGGENKLFNIADSINRKMSVRTVEVEMAKCELRCANCHRRMTHRRRQHLKPALEIASISMQQKLFDLG